MSNVTLLEDTLRPAFRQPPEQCHPAQINYADFDNNAALKRASDWLGDNWNKLAAINTLRTNPHPEDKPATHARKVREAVDRHEHGDGGKWDGAKAALKADLKRVEIDLEATANLKANDKHFNAIVGSFRDLKPEERAQTINQLIDQGEGPALASLIEAPLFVTGLTAEQRDSIRLRVFTKVNPKGLALRDQLVKSLDKMEAAMNATLPALASLREGTDRFDKRAKEAQAVADKARLGFVAN